jgi:hypothetical protein
MALSLSNGELLRPVHDVLHVLVAPCTEIVERAVLALLEQCDRERWYPSMLVEEYQGDPEAVRLAQAARLIGVPVMVPRSPRGEPWGDWTRSFLDEWFYIRNARASILHVHAASNLTRWAPVRWIRVVTPQLKVIESVYHCGNGGVEAGRAEISGGNSGKSTAPLVDPMAYAREVSRLYELAFRRADSRSAR